MAEISKPRRRWLQYSLRTLLVFMVLVAIGLSWLAVKIQQAKKQRQSLETLKALGGDASVNPGPEWLRNLLGEDLFATAYFTSLEYSSINESDAQRLKEVMQLQFFSLSGEQVTDASMTHLKQMTQVHVLSLVTTRVTDAGLEHLKGLKQLEGLDLTGTRVTKEGVRKLRQALPKCSIE